MLFRVLFQAERVACMMLMVAVCLTVLVQASTNDDNEYAKEKRANILRFVPFPRTGRSDPEMMAQNQQPWDSYYGAGASADNALSSMEEYDADVAPFMDGKHAHLPFGRQSQVSAFPVRYLNAAKRAGVTAGANGMWFGPRLGRVQKRDPQQQQQGDH